MADTREQRATDKIVIQEVFVNNPPGWFRKVGNGPWESVSLAPYNGMLPVVWLKDQAHLYQRETWTDPRAVESSPGVAPRQGQKVADVPVIPDERSVARVAAEGPTPQPTDAEIVSKLGAALWNADEWWNENQDCLVADADWAESILLHMMPKIRELLRAGVAATVETPRDALGQTWITEREQACETLRPASEPVKADTLFGIYCDGNPTNVPKEGVYWDGWQRLTEWLARSRRKTE